jgi:hypothetical protein
MNFKAGLFTAMGVPISGAVDLTLRVQRDADYWFLDWNDGIFYAPAHIFVTIDVAMAEPDAVHAPGWYMYNIPDATLAAWNTGIYTVYMHNAGALAPPPWYDITEIRLPDALGSTVIIPAIVNAILDADLQLHLGAGVAFRNIGNILGQLAQSEFEHKTYVPAVAPVVAQGIDAYMVARGCIQYERIDMSYTYNWAAPDRTYYILYHYNAQRMVDMVKPNNVPVW